MCGIAVLSVRQPYRMVVDANYNHYSIVLIEWSVSLTPVCFVRFQIAQFSNCPNLKGHLSDFVLNCPNIHTLYIADTEIHGDFRDLDKVVFVCAGTRGRLIWIAEGKAHNDVHAFTYNPLPRKCTCILAHRSATL